jgi:hypothetical protein
MSVRGLDPIGLYIVSLHSLLGHDKAAAGCGADPGDKRLCVICQYEAYPSDERRRAVIEALAPPVGIGLAER